MNFPIALFAILILGVGGLFFAAPTPSSRWNESTPLSAVLAELGDSTALYYSTDRVDSNRIRQGYDIIHRGSTLTDHGESSLRVSRYFVCTDCHNVVVEDPNLRLSDPEARLGLASKREIPFLPGTTLQGVVNRESWYNDDYATEYGQRALQAHNDLRKAIQLCAEECSKGRPLEEWELEAILAYLQTIEYRLGDLNLSDTAWDHLRAAEGGTSPAIRASLVAELKSYYLKASPATFLSPPANLQTGYGLRGDRNRGEEIYRLSCLHCHKPGRVTDFELDTDTASLKRLKGKIPRNRASGFYQALRYGISPKPERQQYMPRYSAQRMSDQQIEDLRAFVEDAAR